MSGGRPSSEVVAATTIDDAIDRASMDSFPASDPPPFWGAEPPGPATGAGTAEEAPNTTM